MTTSCRNANAYESTELLSGLILIPIGKGKKNGSLGIAVMKYHSWRRGVSRIANPTYRWRITENLKEPKKLPNAGKTSPLVHNP